MLEVSIIGLDIAKHVFQAHGVDSSGRAVLRKKGCRPKLLPFFAAVSVIDRRGCARQSSSLPGLGRRLVRDFLQPRAYRPVVNRPFDSIALIGLGLIGSSIARGSRGNAGGQADRL